MACTRTVRYIRVWFSSSIGMRAARVPRTNLIMRYYTLFIVIAHTSTARRYTYGRRSELFFDNLTRYAITRVYGIGWNSVEKKKKKRVVTLPIVLPVDSYGCCRRNAVRFAKLLPQWIKRKQLRYGHTSTCQHVSRGKKIKKCRFVLSCYLKLSTGGVSIPYRSFQESG